MESVERRVRGLVVGVMAAVVGLSGCRGTDGPGAGSGFTVRDSGGVALAFNTWTDDDHVRTWSLDPDPVVAIGELEGEPEYELFRTTSARSFPDGRILLVLGGEEIRIFGPEGRHLLTFGRSGEGPGEFGLVQDAHPLGDTAVRTVDLLNRRVSLFDASSGALLDGRRLDVLPASGLAPLDDGSFVGFTTPQETSEAVRSRVLTRWSRLGDRTDTLDLLVRPPRASDADENVRGWLYASFWSTARGDRIWAGWGDSLAIARYDLRGEKDLVIRADMPGTPLTDTARAAIPDPGPGIRMEVPERLPLYGKLLATPGRWLWVRHYMANADRDTTTVRRWDVYDAEGRRTASVAIPIDAVVTEVGDDYVLGVFPDELGVERVLKLRIVKGPSASRAP